MIRPGRNGPALAPIYHRSAGPTLLLPPMHLGLWTSRFLVPRVEGAVLRAAILWISGPSAFGLLAKSLLAG